MGIIALSEQNNPLNMMGRKWEVSLAGIKIPEQVGQEGCVWTGMKVSGRNW